MEEGQSPAVFKLGRWECAAGCRRLGEFGAAELSFAFARSGALVVGREGVNQGVKALAAIVA